MKSFFTLLLACAAAAHVSAQQPHTPCQLQHNHNAASHGALRHNSNGNPALQASILRSDTVDILHYRIALNITDFVTNTIAGFTDVHFAPRMNGVDTLNLDLLGLTVDSIIHANGSVQPFTYDDTLIRTVLPFTHNIGDTESVRVYYHGVPNQDQSWGGFYFNNGYAYNLGVGFDADPHNFGRVWFPCFDNFVERSTYTFDITTNNGKLAYCNGYLVADNTDSLGFRTRTWQMDESIPSYLASVAVAGYTQVNQTFTGIQGNVPVILAAVPGDTTNVKNSFLNLEEAFDAFEDFYGPYRWNKVGYVLVPFNAGAMEHSTNIAYPRAFANGSLTYEAPLMAHELAHQWFGDLATCRTAEDMWLNEGWASFSSFLFTEWVYGRNAYRTDVLANHEDLVHNVHLEEGGYRAVSGVPHQYTYGSHVYNKGADVAHTLRGYMGDSAFRVGLQHHLNVSQFKDVSSADFRDNLVAATGQTYLNDFFNDWVFNGGWPQFSIDSFTVTPNGPNYDVQVFFEQKRNGAPNFYTNVPLDVTFKNAGWTSNTQRYFHSGQYTTQTFTVPFIPTYIAIDFDEKISDATADEWKVISTTGSHNFTKARCNVTVNTISDSALFRVEHHFAAPDPVLNNVNNYRISDYRYWTIDGLLPNTFYATARFYYDGRALTPGASGNLDNGLTIPNGDSIILLYRRDGRDNWREYPHYTKTVIGNSATSKYGYVTADTLKLGEYAFANGVSTVLIGEDEITIQPQALTVFPNPAGTAATVQLKWDVVAGGDSEVLVFDLSGKCIFTQSTGTDAMQLNTQNWNKGMYMIQVRNGREVMNSKLVIE